MWPRDQLDISQVDLQWSGEEGERNASHSDTQKTSDALVTMATTSTFKTKAMTSPSKSHVDSHINENSSDDLLTIADINPQKTFLDHVTKTTGVFPRQRTDSDADTEECATFVIPGNQLLRKPIEISDNS
jgi:hypothetical protein